MSRKQGMACGVEGKRNVAVSSCQEKYVKIQMIGEQLEEVSSFKYFGTIISAE